MRMFDGTVAVRMLHSLAPAAGWLPTLAFLLYSVKIRIVDKYFSSILTASGRADDSGKPWEMLFLFREDLLLFGLLIPLLLALAWHWLPRRLALLLSILLQLVACILLYANLQSWGQVGRFLTSSALIDSVAFAFDKPDMIGSYLSLDGFLKFLAVLCLGIFFYALAQHWRRLRGLTLVFGASAATAMLACTVASAIGWGIALRPAPITRSFMLNAITALMPQGADNGQRGMLDDAQLRARFTELAHSPASSGNAPNAGTERNSNIVLFVLETASIEFLDTRRELPAHPVWQLLSTHRYVSANHYSTFPASAESNLSILAGLYPPRAYYDTCVAGLGAQQELPTFIGELRRRGVQTASYMPYRAQVPMDKVVFEHTGFGSVFYGGNLGKAQEGKGAEALALEKMLSDVEHWASDSKQFAVAYFPQLGHGPWDAKLGANIAARGHSVAMRQLDWLYQLVQILERTGALENTVIVLTGDHGVRTLQEDPAVKVGMIDRYSLHVPLVLIAPHSEYPAGISSRPTSHIDLAAELTHLFGLPRPPLMQGLPLLHEAVATRRQFFMASWYFGADGYREQEHTAMYSQVMDAVFARNDGLVSFEPKDLVRDSGLSQEVRDLDTQFMDLQEEWIRRYACPHSRAL